LKPKNGSMPEGVLREEGPQRAHFLIEKQIEAARRRLFGHHRTPHPRPGLNPIRWNAMAMVVRANKHTNVGGHIASFASSSATLYDVGFNISGMPRARSRWRSDLFPGPFGARHLRPRLPARPHHRSAAGCFPPGSRRRRDLVLSAPVADAGFLAVPDRVDGLGTAAGHLSGPLHEVPAGPRHANTEGGRKVWAFMGDGETDEPKRWAPSAWPVARSSTT
jgi:pyruvate dehydrogenase E1 component